MLRAHLLYCCLALSAFAFAASALCVRDASVESSSLPRWPTASCGTQVTGRHAGPTPHAHSVIHDT